MRFQIGFIILGITFFSCQKRTQPCFEIIGNKHYIEDSVFVFNCSNKDLNFQWDFGDGATSRDEQPFHIYSAPGKYPVTLNTINEQGQKLNGVTHLIDIKEFPIPLDRINGKWNVYYYYRDTQNLLRETWNQSFYCDLSGQSMVVELFEGPEYSFNFNDEVVGVEGIYLSSSFNEWNCEVTVNDFQGYEDATWSFTPKDTTLVIRFETNVFPRTASYINEYQHSITFKIRELTDTSMIWERNEVGKLEIMKLTPN